MPAPTPSSKPPPAAANPSNNQRRKRKPRPKTAPPSALNPNWAQLQSKLPHRPAATHLGKRKHDGGPPAPAEPSPPPAVQEVKLEPTSDDTSLTKAVAIDCEMVGVGSDGSKSALGRVTLVNSFGNVVYDEYVRAVERIVDYRTQISGIRPKHMNKAKEFWVVQKEVAELIKGRVLVGHALHNDLKLVFSSSAAVYGSPKNSPCTEEFPLTPNNPYGKTKLVVEDICRDIYRSDPEWKIILLRYFNPVGAHPSGYLGEDPRGIPNNLMPYVQQVAVGRRPALTVLGNDYATRDGTGVRDYIHVVDLADGHIAALQKLFENSSIGCEAYNLGTGRGTSVLEIVNAFEKASGKKIPLIFGERRPGDAEILFSETTKAERELNWKAKYGIEEMCRDQWNWASKNPYGYGSPDSTKQNGHQTNGSADSKQNGHHTNGSTDSPKRNGHYAYGSTESPKRNGHHVYGSSDFKQNGNGHLR